MGPGASPLHPSGILTHPRRTADAVAAAAARAAPQCDKENRYVTKTQPDGDNAMIERRRIVTVNKVTVQFFFLLTGEPSPSIRPSHCPRHKHTCIRQKPVTV